MKKQIRLLTASILAMALTACAADVPARSPGVDTPAPTATATETIAATATPTETAPPPSPTASEAPAIPSEPPVLVKELAETHGAPFYRDNGYLYYSHSTAEDGREYAIVRENAAGQAQQLYTLSTPINAFYGVADKILAVSYAEALVIDPATGHVSDAFNRDRDYFTLNGSEPDAEAPWVRVLHVDPVKGWVYYWYSDYPNGSGLYFCALDGSPRTRLTDDNSQFIVVQNDILYYSEWVDDELTLFALPVGEAQAEALVILPRTSAFEADYMEPTDEFVQKLAHCGDRIVMTVGSIQGSGHYFHGDLVSIRKDGTDFVSMPLGKNEPAESNFAVSNGAIYITGDIDDAYGIYRVAPDLSEAILAVQNAFLYCGDDTAIVYDSGVISGSGLYDLCLLDTASGQSTTIYSYTAMPAFADFSHIDYADIWLTASELHFTASAWCYNPETDAWRGHMAFQTTIVAQRDGGGLRTLHTRFYDESITVQ